MRSMKPNVITVMMIIAIALLVMAGCSAGREPDQKTPQTTGPQTTGPNITEPQEGSILLFDNDGGAAKLIRDMDEGRIPADCTVMYDTMGARPFVTVTDPEVITELYNRLAQITVGAESEMSITDSYHSIYFTLQDGTSVGYGFEGTGLLSRGQKNYEVSGSGSLWSLVMELQDAYMEGE